MRKLNQKSILSHSTKETEQLAANLAKLLKRGSVVTLEGELGTGKTSFAKGMAIGLEIEEPITSPTFTIIKEYEGTLPFYHMDTYRLEFSDEDIGFDEYINGDGITVIEWAQFIEDFLPEELLKVEITYIDEHSRKFTFTAEGEYYEKVLEQLFS